MQTRDETALLACGALRHSISISLPKRTIWIQVDPGWNGT
jgi:hypothetical protein